MTAPPTFLLVDAWSPDVEEALRLRMMEDAAEADAVHPKDEEEGEREIPLWTGGP